MLYTFCPFAVSSCIDFFSGTIVLQRIGFVISSPFLLIRRYAGSLWALQYRERQRLSGEMAQMRGLMPLLMKQRNGYRWSEVDRKRIGVQLRKLAAMSPYLILFLAPGGLLALPLLAWWLDRRKDRETDEAQEAVGE
jgi:hypothetical protein